MKFEEHPPLVFLLPFLIGLLLNLAAPSPLYYPSTSTLFIFIGIILGFTLVTVISVLGFIDSAMLRIKVVYGMASILVVTLVILYGTGPKSRYIPPVS